MLFIFYSIVSWTSLTFVPFQVLCLSKYTTYVSYQLFSTETYSLRDHPIPCLYVVYALIYPVCPDGDLEDDWNGLDLSRTFAFFSHFSFFVTPASLASARVHAKKSGKITNHVLCCFIGIVHSSRNEYFFHSLGYKNNQTTELFVHLQPLKLFFISRSVSITVASGVLAPAFVAPLVAYQDEFQYSSRCIPDCVRLQPHEHIPLLLVPYCASTSCHGRRVH